MDRLKTSVEYVVKEVWPTRLSRTKKCLVEADIQMIMEDEVEK